MTSRRFALSYSRGMRALSNMLGTGPRSAWVDVTDTHVDVRMGWAFRATLPRSSITSVARYDRPVRKWGAHGWRHRWLVNGSSEGIVEIAIEPMARGRALVLPLRLRAVAVSLEDPEDFIAAVAPEPSAGGRAT